MWRAVEEKRDNLAHMKPGAINPFEPKFIWVATLDKRDENTEDDDHDYESWRKDFNQIMAEQIIKHECHYFANISDAVADKNLFCHQDELNGAGRVKFWCKLDKTLEKFDKRKIDLKPRRQPSQEHHLPTPPPKRKSLGF